ncbi:choice-of-anchor D domain-containing protein [Kribbella sp. NBC_01510]|uniref:choice-of-anchor D domain-containing protein n=1 Tax=Kribbella sp. NBC_01510 TaxID=2903581 RepID=UPI003866F47C
MESQQNQRLGQQIKETNAFSHKSLFLGILSSVVSSAIIPALGAGRIATLAGAALSPLLVAVITTRGPGVARTVGIAALSAIALVISIGGFTLPEAIAGRGTLTADGSGTFVNTRRTPTPPLPSAPTTEPKTKPEATTPPTTQPGPKLKMPKSLTCPDAKVGEAEACKQIGVQNVGATTVEIGTAGLEGDQAGDFTLTKVCNGTLKPHSACSVRLTFQPTSAGVREAFLVVHLNPGDVTWRVTISGNAIDNGGDPEQSPGTPSTSPGGASQSPEPEPTPSAG